jgi:hypothetical protein
VKQLRDSLSLITLLPSRWTIARKAALASEESIEQQKGIDHASQNILRAEQQADRANLSPESTIGKRA